MTLTIGSEFAGYGGIDLALDSVLDCRPAWFVEWDEAPSRILAHHWPGVPNLHDVTAIDWSSVEPVDIITGGSPCQDLSQAGQRKGMTDGTRSNLWVSMRESIAVLRPMLVVWENVRGALSACADSALGRCPRCVGADPAGAHRPSLRALGRVLGDLADLGYDAWWYGVRASDVGAAHERLRVFVFAIPADSVVDAWRLLDGNRRAAGDPSRCRGEGVRAEGVEVATASAGAALSGCAGSGVGLTLLPTPRTSDTNGAGQHGDGGLDLRTAVMLPTPRATDGTKGGPGQRGSSGDLMLPSAVALLPTPSVADTQGGRKARSGSRGSELLLNGIAASQAWGRYAAAIARAEIAFGRPAPAPTKPGPNGMPRLSARFVEWHMGLPDGHVTDPAIWDGWLDRHGKPRSASAVRNAQLKALGNGVVPRQNAAAATAFLADLRERAMEVAA